MDVYHRDMKEEIIMKAYIWLRKEHLREINAYFARAKNIDEMRYGDSSKTMIKTFYCIVKNPNKKYHVNKTLKQETVDLSKKDPEYDLRGQSIPFFFEYPDENLLINLIIKRLESISKFGHLDFSVKNDSKAQLLL